MRAKKRINLSQCRFPYLRICCLNCSKLDYVESKSEEDTLSFWDGRAWLALALWV